MKRATPLLLLAWLASASAQPDKLYLAAGETEALMAKEGQIVVVHGLAEGSAKSASGTNFVNFKDAAFFLVTFKSDLGQFPAGEPCDLYEGKRLAVEGPVSVYQGKPQIKLTDPAQVTILGADAVFPPPPPEKKGETAMEAKAKDGPPVPDKPADEAPKRKPPVDPAEYFKK